MFKSIITTIIITLNFFNSQAQTLSGIIQDENNQPLEWATIQLFSLPDSSFVFGTTSGEKGNFLITSTTDEYYIEIDFIGYDRNVFNHHKENGNDLGIIKMQPNTNTMGEVIIKAKRPKIIFKNGTLTYDVSMLKNATDSGIELMRSVPLIRLDKDDNILLRNNSVKVLVNGKDLHLSGEQLNNYLMSLNADEVQKVEVITNPSSKWEAEGAGGIVNIITKNKKPGQYTSISLRGGYGQYPKIGAGISTSFFKNKWAASASFSPSASKSVNFLTLDRINKNSNSTIHQTNEWLPVSLFLNGSGSFNYYLNDKNTISSFIKMNRYDSDAVTTANTYLNGSVNKAYQLIQNELSLEDRRVVGINYDHLLDSTDKKISLELMNIHAVNKEDGQQTNQTYLAELEDIFQINTLSNYKYNINSIKLNYSTPLLSHAKLETGIKISDVNLKSTIAYGYEDDSKDKLLVSLNDNNFNYKEKIYAAFIDLNKKLEAFEIRAGLRLEQTNLETESIMEAQQSLTLNDYLNLFPSFGISYTTSREENISLSFARRLDRPYYEELNPVIGFLDQFSYSQGNIQLTPEYANNFELSFQKNATVISSYANFTTDVMDDIIFQNDINNVIVTMPSNINSSKDYGIDISTSFDASKWGEIDVELYGAYSKTNFANTEFQTSLSTKYWGIDLDYSVDITEKISFNLGNYYSSGGQWGLSKAAAAYVTNVSFAFDLGKASINLKLSDIFATGRWDSTADYANVNVRWINRWENRKASVRLKYNFGKSEASQKARYKKSTYSDEGGRI